MEAVGRLRFPWEERVEYELWGKPPLSEVESPALLFSRMGFYCFFFAGWGGAGWGVGCYNKVSQTGWFKQHQFHICMVSSSGG